MEKKEKIFHCQIFVYADDNKLEITKTKTCKSTITSSANLSFKCGLR